MEDSNTKLANQVIITCVRLTRWLRAMDPDPQLTPTQVSALGIIIFSGGITPSALADLEEVKRPTIARTIGQLEARRLITRMISKEDGRSSLLKATKTGLALFEDGQRRSALPLVNAMRKLSKAELKIICDAFRTIEGVINA